MEEKLLKIINHYGVIHQLKYFQSEVFELNEAIIKHENKNPIVIAADNLNRMACLYSNKKYEVKSIKDITEELADVEVMLLQLKEYYHIDGNDILKIMNEKIDRQLERISKGE